MITFDELKKRLADFSMRDFYAKKIRPRISGFIDGVMDLFDNVTSLFNYITKEIFTDEFLARLHDNFAWLSIAGIVIGYMKSCLDLYRVFFKPDDKANKTIAVLAAIANIGLTVIATCIFAGAFAIGLPILAVVGSAKAAIESFFYLGKSIYDRFFGDGAVAAQRIKALKEVLKQKLISEGKLDKDDEQVKLLTELINKQRDRNTQIVKRAHSLLFINIPMLIGSLFFATGILAKVGVIIMAVASAYGGINLVGLNPIKLAFDSTCLLSKVLFGRRFFLDVFSELNQNEIIHDLKKEAKKDNTKIHVPAFIRQSTTATVIWHVLHPKSPINIFTFFKTPMSSMRKTAEKHTRHIIATKSLTQAHDPHLLGHNNHSSLFAEHQPKTVKHGSKSSPAETHRPRSVQNRD